MTRASASATICAPCSTTCAPQPGQGDLPLVLAGFSFGTFVLSHVAAQLREEGQEIERMVLVGTAASRWDVVPVPENTLVIHGEIDETVPIQSVYDWARRRNCRWS